MTCIFVPFFKEVIGNLVSQAKRLNGLFGRKRFGLVTKEETFKIAVTIHGYRVLITATKIPILYQVCQMSFLDANKINAKSKLNTIPSIP